MCFYNEDYDWVASVVAKSTRTHDKDCKCCECGRVIPAGTVMHRVDQQEHSECQTCEEDWSDTFDENADKETCEHDYGETYSCVWCQDCEHLLLAIEAVEADEGCPEYSRRPHHEGLHDELYELSDRDKYAERALQMFPELAGHPCLMWYEPEEEDEPATEAK